MRRGEGDQGGSPNAGSHRCLCLFRQHADVGSGPPGPVRRDVTNELVRLMVEIGR